jgi:hypothetical protein
MVLGKFWLDYINTKKVKEINKEFNNYIMSIEDTGLNQNDSLTSKKCKYNNELIYKNNLNYISSINYIKQANNNTSRKIVRKRT